MYLRTLTIILNHCAVAHVLEPTVDVDHVAVRLPPIPEDEALDRAGLEHSLLEPLWAHPRHVDVHELPKGNQALGKVLASHPGKRCDPVFAHHSYVDDEAAVLDEPREQRVLDRQLGIHALLKVPLVRAQDALGLRDCCFDVAVAGRVARVWMLLTQLVHLCV